MRSGIYLIHFMNTNKNYVGASKDVWKRLRTHRSELKNCKHWFGNKGMYQDASKNGFDSIYFYILELCDISKLKEREQYWIDKFDSVNDGYNSQSSGLNHTWFGG